MTEMITDFILIACIWTGVFYSGFPREIESMISKRLKVGRFVIPKPFGCQLCMTFWTCLIYGIIVYGFTLPNILLALIAGLSTSVIENVYGLVFDTMNTWIVKLNDKLNF